MLDNESGGAVEFDYRIKRAPDSLFLDPFMAFLWFFDIKLVAHRSLICAAIKDCDSPRLAEALVYSARRPGPDSWIKNEIQGQEDLKIIVGRTSEVKSDRKDTTGTCADGSDTAAGLMIAPLVHQKADEKNEKKKSSTRKQTCVLA